MKLNLSMLEITNINDKRGQKIAGKVDHVVAMNGVLRLLTISTHFFPNSDHFNNLRKV